MFNVIKGRSEKIFYCLNIEYFRIQREELRKTFYLFGKKIYRLRKINNRKIYQKLLMLENLIKASIPVQQIPKATGLLRDIQLAELKMLKEIQHICQQHQLIWWLDFGSLLGAVRHQGFIPWDDDVDISMLREDYQKFIDIFNEHTKDHNLQVVRRSHENGTWNIVKVIHKKIPSISIDIFPCDNYYQNTSLAQKLKLTNDIKSLAAKHAVHNKHHAPADLHNSFLTLRDEKIDHQQNTGMNNPTLFYGCEFYHTEHRYIAFDYDTIFPLSSMPFEGLLLPCVHQPDIHLTLLYNNYLQFPKALNSHTQLSQISTEEIIAIKNYILENQSRDPHHAQ